MHLCILAIIHQLPDQPRERGHLNKFHAQHYTPLADHVNPQTAAFGRRPAGSVPAAPFPLGRWHAPCLPSAGLPLRFGQRQNQLNDSFGLSGVLGSPTRPVLPASQPRCRCSLKEEGVREHLQRGWDARRWHLPVGVRWQRLQCRVAAFYFHRVSLPVQFWRACGCPPQFRPRLPWWQPFVWRWLVLSGWLP